MILITLSPTCPFVLKAVDVPIVRVVNEFQPHNAADSQICATALLHLKASQECAEERLGLPAIGRRRYQAYP